MKISSELEALLLLAKYHLAGQAVLSGGATIANESPESLQALVETHAQAIVARLAEVAVRSAILHLSDISGEMSLSQLVMDIEIGLEDRLICLPQNVHVLPGNNIEADMAGRVATGDSKAQLQRTIGYILASITPREERVVRQTFRLGSKWVDGNASGSLLPPSDVAEALGMSAAVVRRTYAKAMLKLKNASRSGPLLRWLDAAVNAATPSPEDMFIRAVFDQI